MRRQRKSLLFAWACAAVTFLRNLFAKSHAIQFVSECYGYVQRDFQEGCFRELSDAERDRDCLRYRFRRFWMRGIENSRLLTLLRHFWQGITACEMASIGSFGILYGAFSACVIMMRGNAERESLSLLCSLMLAVLSLPLLRMEQPVGRVLAQSLTLGWFLFSFCRLPELSFAQDGRGQSYRWSALLLALVGGVMSLIVSPLLLFCLLFAGAALLLLFAVPELGVLLILFCFPLWHLGEYPTVVLAVAVLLSELAWLAKAFCGRRTFRFGVSDYLALLLSFSFLGGGLVGFGGRIGFWTGLLDSLFLFFWFPTVNLLSQPLWRRRAFDAIIGGALFASLLGIALYLTGNAPLLWVDLSRFSAIGGRACGCFQNPNVFAVFLLLTTPLSLCVAIDPARRRFGRTVGAVCFLLSLGALVLTWTRGAWLGILVSLLFFWISFSRRSFGGLLLTLPPILSLLPLLPQSVSLRFSSIGRLTDSSTRYRLYTWKGVGRLLQDWTFGIGTGQAAFARVYPQYAVSGTETVAHTHQVFLQVFAELGLAGLLVFLTFLIMLFFETAYGLRYLHGSPRAELLGCAAAVLGCFVMGLFDHLWYQSGMLCLLSAVSAMLSGTVREGRECDLP